MNALIQLEAIGKTYHMGDNRIKALKSIDLTLETGAFAALQRPSGSGKSTLLNLCGLLDQAEKGSFYQALPMTFENLITQSAVKWGATWLGGSK